MSVRVALHHRTSYRYPRPITLGPQVVRLKPAHHGRTPIAAYNLSVEPEKHFVNWQQDPFANPMARLVFPDRTDRFTVTVDLVVDLTAINPFDFFLDDDNCGYPIRYDELERRQLAPYLTPSGPTPRLSEWLVTVPTADDSIIDWLVAVNRSIGDRVGYTIRMEPGVQSPEDTLRLGTGSCRDSAWLMVEALRQLGLASRFVSGYLIQLAVDEKPIEGPAGPDNDFCDLHAWAEVYLPGAGWVGLDPTSGLFAGEGHIPLCATPHYAGAAPITGGHEPCDVEFDHHMSVTRVRETPRVTAPIDDAAWDRLLAVGDAIDARLDAGDVRLTMGGEPTFVSIDDVDDPQWNTEAVGEHKRVLSNVLLQNLRETLPPGSLTHYGQGKWYPGESLPRWALTCLWRTDGVAVWNDPELLADEGRDHGHTHDDAGRFVRHLATELGVDATHAFPVHEDAFYYLWREQKLPVDQDPSDPKLDDPNERSMMARAFTRGLSQPAGFALPLRRAWWQAAAEASADPRFSGPRRGWVSGSWPTRRDGVVLVPGDSPAGLRLPLDGLPEDAVAAANVYSSPADPSLPKPPLPESRSPADTAQRSIDVPAEAAAQDVREQRIAPEGSDVVATALCVEARHGRVHVFMPPLSRLEDYLDLTTAVESTAAALSIPVIVEGYLPPPDDRIELFKITPDPGVIEVNVAPSSSWRELVRDTETLHAAAKNSRLAAEKFDLDGRHTGTGGGAHIVMGSHTPLHSPFLRRPHLLASLVALWNNHPSLSYLFSGKFIGPTSQAPRMDESRLAAVDEMEIALHELRRLTDDDAAVPPWTTDRLFRDLLVDVTGNTHRTEICIDKLYSPDSATGRLGLVELRGFEMPPHPRLHLAQNLLIRGIIAAFWEAAYDRPLRRLRHSLYDRYMLPHYVWSDFVAVLDELRRRGIDLDPSWYAASFEFRFPIIGETSADDVHLELRSALEPWHVTGEDPGVGGTSRFVDSSLERVQVTVDHYDPATHAVIVNGRRLPMRPTGVPGRHVAGVRYRAWQPPRCLHPTIGVHTPLQFDIVRRSAGRSVGGCRYHTSHPGGRAHETFPVNSREAQSRRLSRFEPNTTTGDDIELPDAPECATAADAFVTLDLRRPPAS